MRVECLPGGIATYAILASDPFEAPCRVCCAFCMYLGIASGVLGRAVRWDGESVLLFHQVLYQVEDIVDLPTECLGIGSECPPLSIV